MKLKSLIMFSAAALAFAACSNEENLTEGQGGNYALTINVVDPSMSRAVTDPSEPDGGSGNIVKVQGEITVEIKVGNEWISSKKTGDIKHEGNAYTFYNLSQRPTVARAYVNNGDQMIETGTDGTISSTLSIDATAPAMQAEPAHIPAFGSGNVSTESNGVVVIEGEEYDNYTATVKMEIPVARLEVGNIKHIDTQGTTCSFTGLTLTGVYMDHIAPTYGAVQQDYYYPQNGSMPLPIVGDLNLSDEITSGTAFPANGKVYAYNFFENQGTVEDGNANFANPVFKLCFTHTNTTNYASPRYAIIKDYMKDGQSIKLEAGHIYRITDVELSDDNLGPREEPDENTIAVTVTVEEAQWVIEDITATWY